MAKSPVLPVRSNKEGDSTPTLVANWGAGPSNLPQPLAALQDKAKHQRQGGSDRPLRCAWRQFIPRPLRRLEPPLGVLDTVSSTKI